ncbi:hypothetical protein ACFE04_015256 [Oxalis oulophora]
MASRIFSFAYQKLPSFTKVMDKCHYSRKAAAYGDEDSKGIKAMVRGKILLRDNIRVSAASFFVLTACSATIGTVYDNVIVFFVDNLRIRRSWNCLLPVALHDDSGRSSCANCCVFVCKSHRHEFVDKPLLADHLDADNGDYVPLKTQDVQLERISV